MPIDYYVEEYNLNDTTKQECHIEFNIEDEGILIKMVTTKFNVVRGYNRDYESVVGIKIIVE